MKTIKSLLNPFRAYGHRYDRYYQGVIAPGPGYPTYDEARKDMMVRDLAVNPRAGWR
jgi:hypothetical protein